MSTLFPYGSIYHTNERVVLIMLDHGYDWGRACWLSLKLTVFSLDGLTL